MADRCECGRIIKQPTTGRRRTRCDTCAPTRIRPERNVPRLPAPARIPVKPAEVTQLPKPKATDVVPAPGPGPVTDATMAELVEAGRQETSTGREALLLAGLLDAGGYTAQGAAALAKARREALAVALAGAPSKADRLDELRARRQAKASRA